MKRLMAVGAMLALMMLAAVPAFADTAVGGDVTANFVDASQTQAATAWQVNRGDAEAGNVSSAAAIDQSLTIDQSQVNAGWGGVASGADIWWNPWWR